MTTKDTAQQAQASVGKGEVAVFQKPRLPWSDAIAERFGDLGVNKSTWKALIEAVFPAAKSVDSVVLALSYCKARRLDPFKRPVYIVPVWDSNRQCYVDTVWPGISEIRTTAVRTGQYAGCDDAEFGPDVTREFKSSKEGTVQVTYPAWCKVTVYKIIAGQRVPVAGPRVYWLETYARQSRSSDAPNEMWAKRPRGQLEKCAEAAALRRAFPEEIGNEYIADEAHNIEIAARNARDVTPPGEAPEKRPERSDYQEMTIVDDEPSAEEQPPPVPDTLNTDDVRTDLVKGISTVSTARALDTFLATNLSRIERLKEEAPDDYKWLQEKIRQRRAALNASEG